MNIQWYPGHMTKARRMMQENIKLIDLVIELVDARAPMSSRNPDIDDLAKGKARLILLNKSDLASERWNDAWAAAFKALHLSILIETMRRQGYEFQVSRPQVITKEIDGVRNEPVEILMIEVPDEYVGAVMEKLGTRKAELVNMDTNGSGTTHIEFRIPSRGLMGYRPEFLTDTNGNGIMNHVFDAYEPWKGEIITRHQGSLIAWETGDTVAYGLNAAQERTGYRFVD